MTTTGWAAASSREPDRQPSSAASASAASARGSWQMPGPKPAAARQRAAQAPLTPEPIRPTGSVLGADARARAETAAAAPVRSQVTERPSITASDSPVSASETTITPTTTGRPRSGLAGNEVTHLTIARPSPRAGIARKSPGGLSR